ncbi:hypothetical protein F4810DRAFT_38080 [Camillea tinctor]|nr:hypothetical protein F4810DRAFT_38080 [Camillea tinctor]
MRGKGLSSSSYDVFLCFFFFYPFPFSPFYRVFNRWKAEHAQSKQAVVFPFLSPPLYLFPLRLSHSFLSSLMLIPPIPLFHYLLFWCCRSY